MHRDPAALAATRFDLLVVGGGIHGAALARAATAQGLAVALIEQGDFGHATSANSQKVIHGGLRYLQQLDLRRVRESVAARRRLLGIAPHWVRPLPLTVATRGRGLFSRPVLGTALLLNDLLGFDRNRGVAGDRRLPHSRLLSAQAYAATAPALADPGASGGARWYDATAINTERLTLGFVQAAVEAGAIAANYVAAEELIRHEGRVLGVRARDRIDGRDFELRAGMTLLAAGPWTGQLLGAAPQAQPDRWCKGVNLVLSRQLLRDGAMGFFARDPLRDRQALVDKGGRLYFVVPWRDRNIVGTYYTRHVGAPGECGVTEQDIAALLAELNGALIDADPVERHEVVAAHAGLLPLADQGGPGLTLAKRHRFVDGRRLGLEGLVALVGVKYTTAQIAADEALKRILPRLGRAWSPQPDLPLPGGEHWAGDVPDAATQHLLEQYGTRYEHILRQAGADWHEPVAAGDPTTKGEIVHAVRAEMACRLEDVLFRRTLLGTRGHPGRTVIDRCGTVMAAELGWGAQRLTEEIANAESRFGLFRA